MGRRVVIAVRTALWISGFLGALSALLGTFSGVHDIGVGLAVAAASVLGWGICDWLEEQ